MSIDEKSLNKGHLRKLTALRKSLGADIADPAFLKWQKKQASGKAIEIDDPVAKKIEAALSGLVKDKTVRLGNLGYTIRRAKGKGASGFVVTKNVKK